MLEVPCFALAVHCLLFVNKFKNSAQQGLKENLPDKLYFFLIGLFYLFWFYVYFWVRHCLVFDEEFFLFICKINLNIVKFYFLVILFFIGGAIYHLLFVFLLL